MVPFSLVDLLLYKRPHITWKNKNNISTLSWYTINSARLVYIGLFITILHCLTCLYPNDGVMYIIFTYTYLHESHSSMPVFANRVYSFKTVNPLLLRVSEYLCAPNACNGQLIPSKKNGVKPAVVKVSDATIWENVMTFGSKGWNKLHVMGNNLGHLIKFVFIVRKNSKRDLQQLSYTSTCTR